MRIVITEEVHNRVAWIVRAPFSRVAVGLLIGAVVASVPLLFTARWVLLGLIWGGCLAAALYLALSEPVQEFGLMERTPEGGVLRLEQQWLLGREPVVMEVPLDEVAGFTVEPHTFEHTGGQLYTLARLWAINTARETLPLVRWTRPQAAQTLGESLARAARRPLHSEAEAV